MDIIKSTRKEMDPTGSFPDGYIVVTLNWEPSNRELAELRAKGYHEFEFTTKTTHALKVIPFSVAETSNVKIEAWKVIVFILSFVAMSLICVLSLLPIIEKAGNIP